MMHGKHLAKEVRNGIEVIESRLLSLEARKKKMKAFTQHEWEDLIKGHDTSTLDWLKNIITVDGEIDTLDSDINKLRLNADDLTKYQENFHRIQERRKELKLPSVDSLKKDHPLYFDCEEIRYVQECFKWVQDQQVCLIVLSRYIRKQYNSGVFF